MTFTKHRALVSAEWRQFPVHRPGAARSQPGWPWTLGSAIGLFVLFLWLLVMGAAAGAALLSSDVDVFADYASLRVGQPFSTADQQRCNRLKVADRMAYCYVEVGDGIFDLVVITTKDGVTQDILYRSAGLLTGDLILYWGHPDAIQRHHKRVILSWNTGICAVADGQSRERSNYRLPVLLIAVRSRPVTRSLSSGDPASAPGPQPACGY